MSFPPNDQPPGDAAVIPLADAPPAPESPAPSAPDGAFTPDPLTTLQFTPRVVEALSKVFDPEIPVNIYELGLIYAIGVDVSASVRITMTLTAPACPAAQTLPGEVERRVRAIPGVADARVDVVWDPPWTHDRMSEAAKLQLGML